MIDFIILLFQKRSSAVQQVRFSNRWLWTIRVQHIEEEELLDIRLKSGDPIFYKEKIYHIKTPLTLEHEATENITIAKFFKLLVYNSKFSLYVFDHLLNASSDGCTLLMQLTEFGLYFWLWDYHEKCHKIPYVIYSIHNLYKASFLVMSAKLREIFYQGKPM